ncbi:MAG: nuclear transport factor 2 family protein [Pseudomonadota bacterium]
MTISAPFTRSIAATAIALTPFIALANQHYDQVGAAQYELDQAYANGDVEKIRSLVTPDHVAITSYYPSITTTAEQIASMKDANYTVLSDGDPIYRTIGEDDDVVSITVTKSYSGHWGDREMPAHAISTSIWSLHDGKWLQSFYQETPVSPAVSN